MKAIEFLKTQRDDGLIPCSKEGDKLHIPSNAELRRWLLKGSVVINGKTTKPYDEIHYPIDELVYFPRSKSVCTMVMTDEAWERNKKIKRR